MKNERISKFCQNHRVLPSSLEANCSPLFPRNVALKGTAALGRLGVEATLISEVSPLTFFCTFPKKSRTVGLQCSLRLVPQTSFLQKHTCFLTTHLFFGGPSATLQDLWELTFISACVYAETRDFKKTLRGKSCQNNALDKPYTASPTAVGLLKRPMMFRLQPTSSARFRLNGRVKVDPRIRFLNAARHCWSMCTVRLVNNFAHTVHLQAFFPGTA